MKTLYILVVLFSHGDGNTTVQKGDPGPGLMACTMSVGIIKKYGLKLTATNGKKWHAKDAWCEKAIG